MIEYPKIETLYDRNEKTFKVMPDKWRRLEFGRIKAWRITEKVDGTNVRVGYKLGGAVQIGGRTANAQMQTNLVNVLRGMFTTDKMAAVFADAGDSEVVLFGEGYGGNIQSAGKLYRPDPSFRLFDVKIGEWWLEIDSINDIAKSLGIETVPDLGWLSFLPRDKADLLSIVSETWITEGGMGGMVEGIVARTSPLLLNRKGERVMWKLKIKDF